MYSEEWLVPNQLVRSRLNIGMAGATILDPVFSGLAGEGQLFERFSGGGVWGDACGQGCRIQADQRGSNIVRWKEDGRPNANRA